MTIAEGPLPSAGRRWAEGERKKRLATKERLLHGQRNDRLLDLWSINHFLSGVLLGWLIDPFLALVILILWEPFEIFVLSPLAWKWFSREFGYESWRNAISDIVVDAAGVAVGAWVLLPMVARPF